MDTDDDDEDEDNETEWKIFLEENNAHITDVNWFEFGPRTGVSASASASDDCKIKIRTRSKFM